MKIILTKEEHKLIERLITAWMDEASLPVHLKAVLEIKREQWTRPQTNMVTQIYSLPKTATVEVEE